MAADPHPAVAFVHEFHDLLSAWFSGRGEREATWAALQAACDPELVLIYPSGTRLERAELLAALRGGHGGSPGFYARIRDAVIVHATEDTVVVAYVEEQVAAQNSAPENVRAALAVVRHGPDGWAWRYIQETDLAQ